MDCWVVMGCICKVVLVSAVEFGVTLRVVLGRKQEMIVCMRATREELIQVPFSGVTS